MPYYDEYENPSSMEKLIFDFLEQCKFLFFPEQWNQLFLDFSKNDVFVLLLVYRRKQVNMTEIAEYLQVPLNTVTGVVSRLEKKELVLRERSLEDKRVVTICLTELGQKFLADEIAQISKYYLRAMEILSSEEKAVLFQAVEKVFKVLHEDMNEASEKAVQSKQVKRITIE